MRWIKYLLALCLLAAPLGAYAQNPGAEPGEGLDSKAPLKISAEQMVTDKKAGKVVFSGKVTAVKGKLTITTDEMTVWTSKEQRDFRKIVAKGSVIITREDKTAGGDEAEYFNEDSESGQEERIEIRGNASLRDGKNTATGKVVIYFFKTEDMRSFGDESEPSVVTFFPEDSKPSAPEAEPETKPAPPATEMKHPEPAQQRPIRRYAIQAASYQRKKDAEQLASKLASRSYHPLITEAKIKGAIWHRVRLGDFNSEEEAWAIAEKLREDFGLKPMVIQHSE